MQRTSIEDSHPRTFCTSCRGLHTIASADEQVRYLLGAHVLGRQGFQELLSLLRVAQHLAAEHLLGNLLVQLGHLQASWMSIPRHGRPMWQLRLCWSCKVDRCHV